MRWGIYSVMGSTKSTNGWQYKRSITIDHTKVGGTLTDFTMLISGTYPYLRTKANGGNVLNSNGYDIAFFLDEELTTMLDWETERYVASTGEVVYWVKIPSLNATTDTVIYMAYGKSSITTDQSDAVNAWDSNTKAVYRLSDGTTLSVADSIGVNNGTTSGSVTAVSAKIDGGANFAGTNNYINVGGDSSLETQVFTWTAWVKPSGSGTRGVFGHTVNVNPQLILDGNNALVFNSQGSATLTNTGNNAISNDTWSLIGIWTDGTNYGLFYNGAYNSQVRTVTFVYGGDIYIGNEGTLTFDWIGDMDQVKFSNVARSEAWLDTEYNNQLTPSTFYTISSEIPYITNYDSDALAFLTTTGITNYTERAAINNLVIAAKANGWWSLCYAIYPFVGATSTRHSYNLKNTAQYQLTFGGGWTHSATGSLPNGTTGYADTGINISSVFTLNDSHISYYSRTNTAVGNKREWGAYIPGGGENGIQFLSKINIGSDVALSDMYDLNGTGARATAANSTTDAYFMVSRQSGPTHVIYKDGTSLVSDATTGGSLVNLNLFLAAYNDNGTAAGFTDRECAFATVGTGMNGTLASTMYNDIQTFQTALGRQV